MKEITKKLIARQNLSEVESYDLFSQFFDVPVEQQAAILALLAAKGETLEELLGARAFLIEHTDRVMINHPYNMIDIVGTGGDDLGTFNISTAASMVIASCGAYVAKHGGSSVTSQSGSSDVISHLGVPIYHSCEKIIESLTKNHYAYLSAPLFNKLLTNVKSLRKNLGFPSIFNILGPLINPVHPKRQVIGVYRHDLVRTVVQLLYQMGSQHALVVHSEDGLDEISISAPTYVAELKNGCITEYRITPESVGLSTSKLEEILGGTPADNALMIQNIFSGMITGPKLEVVLMNAAAGLLVSGLVNDLRSGVEMARLSIQSGKTSHFLRTLNVGHLDFCDIFNKTDHASIIAEIKFSSPSCAVIYQGELNHVEIAKAYLDNGACALSVLTEPNDFNGHIQYIRDIRNAFPAALILMKDFM